MSQVYIILVVECGVSMIPESKSSEDIALENLRVSIKYFVGQLGKIGLLRIIREIVYILQDEYKNGIPFFLETISDYLLEEGDKAASDVQVTWKRVARQIRYSVQEALMDDRQLP